MEFVDVSQHGEAGMLAALVETDWPRYLVDVGAHDGRSLSNSFPFLQLGWGGVLVEPLPEAFAQLASLYAGRADVHCVQAACAESEGDREMSVGSDAPIAMTSSLRAGGELTVRVRTLTSLLDEYAAPSDFSLLLVDAEGMDREVLAGLDFDRWGPRGGGGGGGGGGAGDRLYTVVAGTNSIWLRADLAPADGSAPLLTPEEAIRTIPREILERRCAELERSRDEIWRRLMVVESSRSWALTRPLRELARRMRGRGG